MMSLEQRVLEQLSQKTKPRGSLNRIDALALQMAIAQQCEHPVADKAVVLVFAADHGISQCGVSAYPREVTAQMVANIAQGGACVCTFATAVGAQVLVYDVGVDAASFPPPVIDKKIARGTARLDRQAAMTEQQCVEAIGVGQQALQDVRAQGAQVVAIGEMGIGNTTSASALSMALLQESVDVLVGPGTGVAGDALMHKKSLIMRALSRVDPTGDAREYLRELGGFEIAAMVGVCLQAVESRCPVIVDGFIATAAALCAVCIHPEVRQQLIFGHRSAEPGHDRLLSALHAQPILDLHMRLGEGSGAVLALPIVRAACTMLRDMATFASAHVTDKQ